LTHCYVVAAAIKADSMLFAVLYGQEQIFTPQKFVTSQLNVCCVNMLLARNSLLLVTAVTVEK